MTWTRRGEKSVTLGWTDREELGAPMNWALLWNSLLVTGATAVLAVAIGFGAAIALVCAGPRPRRLLLAMSIAALMMPPFMVTNCWLDLLGQNGSLRSWLPLNIYSVWGAVGLLSLSTWPVVAVLVSASWNRLESSQLESDVALRGFALFRWLLWPMARASVGQAALVVSVLALNNFSVPVILQVPVFPEELWLALTARLDATGAWAAAAPLILVPTLALIFLRPLALSWPRTEGAIPVSLLRRQIGGRWCWCAGIIAVFAAGLSVGLPISRILVSRRTWAELPNLLHASPEVVWNSFLYAAVAATLSVGIGWWSRRWALGPWVWVLFFVPGILLGQAMVVGFASTALAGSTSLVFATMTFHYLAPARHGVVLAWRAVDRDLIDAARVGGADGWSLWRSAYWPQLAGPVGFAWYLTYLLCLWDVETLVLMYPPGGETLALRAFQLLHYGHNAQVNGICLIALAVALIPWILWEVWTCLLHRRD